MATGLRWCVKPKRLFPLPLLAGPSRSHLVITKACYDAPRSPQRFLGMARLTFENLWVDGRWRTDVTVELDHTQRLALIEDERSVPARGSEYVRGLTLPGLASAHCHAFQRILAPWTQSSHSDSDSFWTWRNAMYAAASCMGPIELEAMAARCYLEG